MHISFSPRLSCSVEARVTSAKTALEHIIASKKVNVPKALFFRTRRASEDDGAAAAVASAWHRRGRCVGSCPGWAGLGSLGCFRNADWAAGCLSRGSPALLRSPVAAACRSERSPALPRSRGWRLSGLGGPRLLWALSPRFFALVGDRSPAGMGTCGGALDPRHRPRPPPPDCAPPRCGVAVLCVASVCDLRGTTWCACVLCV